MHVSNILKYGLAASLVITLSACGGGSGSKKPNSISGTTSSLGTSSIAISSLSVSSVTTSTATLSSSAASSTGASVVEDTTLVLPSSLEVVTNENVN